MFCVKCGAEITEEAAFCSQCGSETINNNNVVQEQPKQETGLQTAAKILMILSCVAMGLCIIPLAWTIPMTVSYCKKVERGEPVGTGFKICTLLFVNTIAGILMLCENN